MPTAPGCSSRRAPTPRTADRSPEAQGARLVTARERAVRWSPRDARPDLGPKYRPVLDPPRLLRPAPLGRRCCPSCASRCRPTSSTAPSTSTASASTAASPTTRPSTRSAAAGEGFVWIGLHEPTEEQITAIAETFGLHELAVEDAVTANQRPKLERYDDSLFMVLKTVTYVGTTSPPRHRADQDRRGHGVRRPRLRRHRPARRPLRAAPGARAAGGRPRAARARPGRGAARDRRPHRRPATSPSPTPSRRTSTRSRPRCSSPRSAMDSEQIYVDEARGAGAAPLGGAAGRRRCAS